MRNRHLTIAAIAMLALGMSVGCGGGGGGSSTPPPTQVTPPPAMAIATTSLPYAVQGVTYSTTLKTNNGTAPFTWRVDASAGSALPIGLNLDRTTGVLSGTPTQPGYFSLVVVVSDSGNPAQTATHMFPFGVDSPFSVSASPWNNLVQYQAASELPWSVSGGVAPYQFSLTQGTLPPGMFTGWRKSHRCSQFFGNLFLHHPGSRFVFPAGETDSANHSHRHRFPFNGYLGRAEQYSTAESSFLWAFRHKRGNTSVQHDCHRG